MTAWRWVSAGIVLLVAILVGLAQRRVDDPQVPEPFGSPALGERLGEAARVAPTLRGDATSLPSRSAGESASPTEAYRFVHVRVAFDELPAPHHGRTRAHVGLGPSGPRDRQRETWSWIEEGERVRMCVPADIPLRVRCGAAPWALEREVIEIPPGQDEATLRLVAGCGFELTILDGVDGLPVRGHLELRVTGADTEEVWGSARSAADLRGWCLPPGRYRLDVAGPGYAPWCAEVHLDRPGARCVRTVRLAPDAGTGRLVLDVEPPAGGTLEGAALHVEIFAGDDEGEVAWRPVEPRTQVKGTVTLTLAPIEPGDVRVLVWAGRDLVGGLEDLAIEAGEARRVRLRLGPGLLLPLTELPWRPTFYTEDRMIVLRTRDGATLPVLHFGSRLPTSSLFFPPFFTKHEHRDERPSRPHSRTVGVETVSVPHDAVLGPYPVDLVEVRETSGRAYRSHVFEGD